MELSVDNPNALTLLLELGQAFHSTLELDPLLVAILKHMQRAAHSEGASIWLCAAEPCEVTCTHAEGPGHAHLVGQRHSAEDVAAAGLLMAAGPAALRLDDFTPGSEAGQLVKGLLPAHTRDAIIAPLIARGVPLGLLVVTDKLVHLGFSETDRVLIGALAGHAAVAIHNAQLYEQERQHAERQRLIEQIGRHLQQTLDSEVLIPRILDEVNKAIEAEGQSLWLLDSATGCIICRYATGPEAEAIKKVTVPMGKGVVGTSVDCQQSIIIPDAQNDDRLFRQADAQTGFNTRSLICVPLVRQGKAIGAIEAVNKCSGQHFTRADLELLRNIADSAALAIENARLYAELAVSYDSTLDALAAALDLRDRETEGHSRRVVAYTARLARQMDLDEVAVGDICRGALLHDVGKIGVPDGILHKPGSLTPDERRIIEKHPQAGYEMLLDIPYLKEEIQIVLSHQEHWDGSGYPFGLRGAEIPLGARLFAIADTYDAITSDRPYRPGATYAEAVAVIAAEAGRQFDPDAVAAFLSIPKVELEAIRAQVLRETEARIARLNQRVRQAQADREMVAAGPR
jgi:HD-GYP domain-containing protein (c-di-GMP phosphodiesterase class II)